jgi:hypothetical protein
VRKILWALVVALFLSCAPVPVAAAWPAHPSCKSHKAKKAKFSRPGKYKTPKLKKGKKHHS